ncbi:MAG: MATE family efflux transporter [Heliobacteriaceae bacterium]|nr:MATE family efflux transporter [Heliobacteriaceae bacterium]
MGRNVWYNVTMLILHDAVLRQRIFKIAAPAMLEMILYMVVGLVDIAFVGRLGAAPLAAVALGSQIFFSVVIFVAALGMGSTILVAQAKGAGKLGDADRVAGYNYFLALLIGVATGWLFIHYAPQIVGLFNAEPAVNAQALSYLFITFTVTPFTLALFMSNAVFRGMGRTDLPMFLALGQNVINIFGDYVLVFGKWGFPAMGVSGAALATAITQVLGFIAVTFLMFSGKGGVRVRFRLLWPLKRHLFTKIFSLGLPSLAEQFFNALSAMVSMYLVVYLGTLAFASHEVALTVESVSLMPGLGIAAAVTALVGQAVGAGDNRALRRSARGSMELGMVIMGTLGLVFAVFPHQVAAIFTNEAEIIAIAAVLIRVAALEQLTIAFSMVTSGILKGTGNTRTPLLVSAGFTWLYRLPLLFVMIRVWQLGINQVWWLFVSDWLLRSMVYLIILRKVKCAHSRSVYTTVPSGE